MLGRDSLRERLRDRLGAGMATVMAQARQRLWIALGGKDRAYDTQVGRAADLGDNVVQLKIHLRPVLLHMLDV